MTRLAALLALTLLLLSLLMTYPLVTNLGGAVLGPPGDNFEYVYKLWWFQHSLETGQSPFFMPDVFYPVGYEVALSETTLANMALGLPLTAAAGEVAAYNVLLLLSFVTSGLGAFLLTTELTHSRRAGVVAAFVFAFLTYRTAHLGAGHLPLMGTGWLPFLLVYVERLIRGQRGRDGLLAGLFYALFALSSWYYAYMGALVALIYALVRAWPWREYLGSRRFWRGAIAGVAVAAVLLAPALLPLLSLSARGEIARATLSLRYVDQWSASITDFVLPSIMHPLWGQALAAIYPQNVHENLLYLGTLPLALALYAIVRRRTRRLAGIIAVGLIAFVLALGTTLHWAGEPVYVSVPAAVESAFTRIMYVLTGKLALNPAAYSSLQHAGSVVIPLPTMLLYLFLPFFNAMRVWARFGLVVGLAVAVVAGWGAAGVLRWPRWTERARVVVLAFILAGIVLDFAVAPYPFGMSTVGPTPVDAWLSSQPGDFAIIELPADKTWRGPALYAARQHGKKIAYGYGTYTPKAYQAFQNRLANFPDDQSLDAISDAGIRYVLVALRSYGDDEQALRQKLAASTRLRFVAVFPDPPVLSGDRLIQAVEPSPLVPPTALVGAVRRAYLQDEIAVYEFVQ